MIGSPAWAYPERREIAHEALVRRWPRLRQKYLGFTAVGRPRLKTNGPEIKASDVIFAALANRWGV
jgi:hypothetical protein